MKNERNEMPELPEVHTITNDIKPYLENALIKGVTTSLGYNAIPNNAAFAKIIKDAKITKVLRIAKNIIISLENDRFILIHLAMTGQLLIKKDLETFDRWERLRFYILKNNETIVLKFCDMRMFGKVAVITKKDIENLNIKYGPDPINKNLTAKIFLEKLRSKKTSIKNALLDQHIVSGIGNIYAAEALYLAKIHPITQTKDITLPMAKTLLTTIRGVLNESIKNRGSTLNDKMYVDAFGKYGDQQEHFKIFGKKKCAICDTAVEIIKINGRSTYLCSLCQKPKTNLSF